MVHTFKDHLCNHFNKIAAFCPCCNSSSAIISSWIWPTLGNLRLETVSVGLPNSDVNPIQAVTVLVHAPHSAPALIQPSTRILLIIWWTTVLVASMGASLLWRITLWLLADQCAPPSSRRDNNGISQSSGGCWASPCAAVFGWSSPSHSLQDGGKKLLLQSFLFNAQYFLLF